MPAQFSPKDVAW